MRVILPDTPITIELSIAEARLLKRVAGLNVSVAALVASNELINEGALSDFLGDLYRELPQ